MEAGQRPPVAEAELEVDETPSRRRVEAHDRHVHEPAEHLFHDPRAEAPAPRLGVHEDHADPGQPGAVAHRPPRAHHAPVPDRGDEAAGIGAQHLPPVLVALVPAAGAAEPQPVRDVIRCHRPQGEGHEVKPSMRAALSW